MTGISLSKQFLFLPRQMDLTIKTFKNEKAYFIYSINYHRSCDLKFLRCHQKRNRLPDDGQYHPLSCIFAA
jgi:hypothetical protein